MKMTGATGWASFAIIPGSTYEGVKFLFHVAYLDKARGQTVRDASLNDFEFDF